jgi:hypothetical protein
MLLYRFWTPWICNHYISLLYNHAVGPTGNLLLFLVRSISWYSGPAVNYSDSVENFIYLDPTGPASKGHT